MSLEVQAADGEFPAVAEVCAGLTRVLRLLPSGLYDSTRFC